MAKVTLKQLKNMIREAVREQLSEQVSGGVASTPKRRGYTPGGSPGRAAGGGNPWLESGFNLNQLVDALKKEQDPQQKTLLKQAVMAKLKSAGW